jgi:hypothetical protein
MEARELADHGGRVADDEGAPTVTDEPFDGHHPVWSQDGRRLYFVASQTEFGYVPVTTSASGFSFGSFVPLKTGLHRSIQSGIAPDL